MVMSTPSMKVVVSGLVVHTKDSDSILILFVALTHSVYRSHQVVYIPLLLTNDIPLP